MFNYDLSDFYFNEEERRVKEREVIKMEIWLPDLKSALTCAQQTLNNFNQYVASIQGCYHGIIFCMTSGEIWRYDIDENTMEKMKGDWR